MRRIKQQLSRQECVDLLKQGLRGVLSVIGDDGYPYGLPINYWYCEETGKVYFHGGESGHKLDALARNSKVSFCVMDSGTRVPGDWALWFQSVILFGHIRILPTSDETLQIIRQLSLKFTQDIDFIEHEIAQYGAEAICLELTPEHMTGKRTHEA
jgi:nitroimidazol reductase NimA-like FMN-containing flavoprotein (pyridoxamine 5'-phosphate oxidase superfamily)